MSLVDRLAVQVWGSIPADKPPNHRDCVLRQGGFSNPYLCVSGMSLTTLGFGRWRETEKESSWLSQGRVRLKCLEIKHKAGSILRE